MFPESITTTKNKSVQNQTVIEWVKGVSIYKERRNLLIGFFLVLILLSPSPVNALIVDPPPVYQIQAIIMGLLFLIFLLLFIVVIILGIRLFIKKRRNLENTKLTRSLRNILLLLAASFVLWILVSMFLIDFLKIILGPDNEIFQSGDFVSCYGPTCPSYNIGSDSEVEEFRPQTQDLVDAGNFDITQYSDIKLENYDGLIVTVSNGYEDVEDIIPGIVNYLQKDYYSNPENLTFDERIDGPLNHMTICNGKNVENNEQSEYFNESISDIVNHNISSEWLETGTLSALRHSLGVVQYTVIKEMLDIDYSNTDNVFSVLLFTGGAEAPYVHNDGANFSLLIFAIKDENIIMLSSSGYAIRDLGMLEKEHTECTYYNESGDSIYELDCLSEILKTTKYDERIISIANTLVDEFELVD